MKKRLGLFVLGMFVVGLIVFLGLYFLPLFPDSTSSGSIGQPAPIVWQEQPAQAMMQNSEGSFSIRGVVAAPKEILFFYGVKAQHSGAVNASFKADANLKRNLVAYTVPVVNVVQPLGRLSDYNIG